MATLDRQTFQKEVASMRNEIERNRTGLFQKLTRAAIKFKTKSAPEEKSEHYKQKAQQIIEEAAEGKMLDRDDIIKFLLSHTEEELEQLLKDPNLQPDVKFKAKMGLQYPSLRSTINHFHNRYPAWKESLPDLLKEYNHKPPLQKKVTELKINNKAQRSAVKEDFSESLISDYCNNWSVTEDLDITLVLNTNKKRMNKFDDNSKGMNQYGKKGKFVQRKPCSKMMDLQQKHTNSDFALNKRFDKFDKTSNKSFTKNNDFKYIKTLNSPEKDALSKSYDAGMSTNGDSEMMVDKTGSENQTNPNETVPVKKNPSSDVEMKVEELKADPFFMTKDNKDYMTSSKVELPKSEIHEDKADNELKSYHLKNFKNMNQKPPYFSDQKPFGNKFNKQDYSNRFGNKFNKQDYSSRFGQNKPKFNSRPTFRPGGNWNGNFKNNQNPKTRYVKLHPSWEAKKKQMASLTEFKGNKIVFN
ncbi:uncharacterized protein LOC106672548 [Cimex lectularius]|uniref:Serum response factor-binding protein 1 n=1 Tax=Cimex lectularius TaxID=79782 RepID=A0A8I6SSZ3_CIMLE|nr:uncharacterized protein LOC106672548 [Cimex lectularius]